jgi:predicted GIY-YIG superfamily endonuclease
MPSFTYILRCADGRNYYGSTDDLGRRLAEHQRGRVRTTARCLPVALVYFEVHPSVDQARKRERGLKNGRTRRTTIDRLIAEFPAERLASYS